MKSYGKFFWKMMLTNFVVVLILITIFVVTWVWIDANAIRHSQENLLREISEKSGEQMTATIQRMERLTYSLATAPEVQTSLRNANAAEIDENYFNRALEDRRALERLIQMLCGSDIGQQSISVVSKRGDYVSLNAYSDVSLSREQMQQFSRLELLQQQTKGKILLPAQKDVYGRTEEELFSLVRTISDPYLGYYGYVEIQIDVSVLDDLFSQHMDDSTMISVLVYDESVFYSSNHEEQLWEEQLGTLQARSREKSVTRAQVGEELFFLYQVPIRQYGLTLYSMITMDQYYKQLTSKIGLVILLGVLMLLVSSITTTIVNRRLYRPIQELRDRMNYEELEDIQLGLHVQNSNDEIEQFHHAFNNLLSNVARQNDEQIQRRMQELEISYRILQSQVSPHFLHNTLSVIGLNGEMHGNPEIMEMCACLTKMMDYSMNAQESKVFFQQELEYTEYYLTLMKYRYLDRLRYQIYFDDALKTLLVPKFILQPLVENCFTHGFKNSLNEYYEIHITGKVTEDGWDLQIEDNGSGLSEERQAQLNQKIRTVEQSVETSNPYFSEKAGGIGLVNTYARLLIALRKEGSITLQVNRSASGGGLVRIVLKKIHNEQEA